MKSVPFSVEKSSWCTCGCPAPSARRTRANQKRAMVSDDGVSGLPLQRAALHFGIPTWWISRNRPASSLTSPFFGVFSVEALRLASLKPCRLHPQTPAPRLEILWLRLLATGWMLSADTLFQAMTLAFHISSLIKQPSVLTQRVRPRPKCTMPWSPRCPPLAVHHSDSPCGWTVFRSGRCSV